MTKVINFSNKLSKFEDVWSPRVIAEMNDYQFKLAKIHGEFVWHSHQETDETFIVLKGEMSIHLRDGEINLKEGEMYVVPKGIEHKPFSEDECHILLIEPQGVVNTEGVESELNYENNVWI